MADPGASRATSERPGVFDIHPPELLIANFAWLANSQRAKGQIMSFRQLGRRSFDVPKVDHLEPQLPLAGVGRERIDRSARQGGHVRTSRRAQELENQ